MKKSETKFLYSDRKTHYQSLDFSCCRKVWNRQFLALGGKYFVI